MSYDLSDLILNLADAERKRPRPKPPECNPGGSTICWTPTKGCGTYPMTCFTTSTKLTSIELEINLPPDELEELQSEIGELVQKFADRKK